VHGGKSITCALGLAGFLLGCGGAAGPGSTVATTPAAERSVQRAGTITVRGDYAPDQHGPYALHGRYRVRFTQRGAGVNFAREVPFTARLEQPVASGPGRSIRLFQRAARSGTTMVRADGRFELVVDFGDSPYEVVLVPAP
jgi:hypothetical protein